MANLRRIHTESNGLRTTRVYRDSEWEEYRVRLYTNGQLDSAADYHTQMSPKAVACLDGEPVFEDLESFY